MTMPDKKMQKNYISKRKITQKKIFNKVDLLWLKMNRGEILNSRQDVKPSAKKKSMFYFLEFYNINFYLYPFYI